MTYKLPQRFLWFLYPGLTTLSFVMTIIALGIGWDSYCEHNNSNAEPHAWLITYAICCIPGFFLSLYGTMEIGGKHSGQLSGPIDVAIFVLFVVFIIGTFILNMVGYGILFGSYKCIDNTLGTMMIINLAYQSSICLISFIRFLVICCA